MPAAKHRLDQVLVSRGLCDSRQQASRLIRAGQVMINGCVADKPGRTVREHELVLLRERDRYVSRGGLKLEHGLREFGVNPKDRVAVDLGASTGGFTDCLLQHGAARVYSVDVGRGQLAWKLRQDPRVYVMEGINARQITRTLFPPEFAGADLVVIDCSFISLKLLLPSAIELLQGFGMLLALVKPQFEAGRREASRGAGVITDPNVHARVLTELEQFVADLSGVVWKGVTPSPILGPAGNKEFLVLLEKSS